MSYATLDEADAYFMTRLYSTLWGNTLVSERENALLAASEQIDRLNFIGEKHPAYVQRQTTPCDDDAIKTASATQARQFPRGADVVVPEDIKKACYEIAYNLIDGKDPEQEYENLTTVSEGYSSVRRTYNRSFAQDHILHGIVSLAAWQYLKPYLRNAQNVKLSRV